MLAWCFLQQGSNLLVVPLLQPLYDIVLLEDVDIVLDLPLFQFLSWSLVLCRNHTVFCFETWLTK